MQFKILPAGQPVGDTSSLPGPLRISFRQVLRHSLQGMAYRGFVGVICTSRTEQFVRSRGSWSSCRTGRNAADRDLSTLKVPEPSCGRGAFIVPIVRRLCAPARAYNRSAESLRNCLLGVHIDSKRAGFAETIYGPLFRRWGVLLRCGRARTRSRTPVIRPHRFRPASGFHHGHEAVRPVDESRL